MQQIDPAQDHQPSDDPQRHVDVPPALVFVVLVLMPAEVPHAPTGEEHTELPGERDPDEANREQVEEHDVAHVVPDDPRLLWVLEGSPPGASGLRGCSGGLIGLC